jgi:ABC-type dipeptide/oligopeptide/nickel transport system permease component
MGTYVLRRLAWLPVILLAVSFGTFLLTRFGPGDPVTVAAGQIRDPELLAEIRAQRGLDRPVLEQYMIWLRNAARGELGESYIQQGYDISELILPRMWISAQLGILSLLIIFGLGIPLGLVAARLAGTWIDPAIISTLLFLRAIPVLVVIPPLVWFFALYLGWLPVGGWDGVFQIWWIADVIAVPIPNKHLYIPLIAFSLPGFAGVARLVRVSALEVITEDYVRTARAKGLSEAAVALRHVFPNSLLPLVTVMGFALSSVIEGAFFVETLLGINGIGRFTFQAVVSRDYDVILATTVIFSAAFVIMNLVAEISYAFIDPRVRLGAERGA